MEEDILHMGVDYGSKYSGTTAAAMLIDGKLKVWESKRGQDADEWLINLIQEQKPKVVYIDAPLTLPAVYAQANFTPDADFFYRSCDREVQAMSPMFIGGLTARAIRLRTILANKGVAMLETYPSQLLHLLLPDLEDHKKSLVALPAFTDALQKILEYQVETTPTDWHQLDALLAWQSGYRHLKGEATLYGEATEGRIIV